MEKLLKKAAIIDGIILNKNYLNCLTVDIEMILDAL
jgi:hypothetical protein